MLVYAAAAAGVIVLVWAGLMTFGRPEVTGQSPRERIIAISRLAGQKPRGAGKAIAEAARSDPDESVRQTAMISLGKFISPDLRGVVEAGTKDKSPAVRAAAAGTLARYGDNPAADRLRELWTKDKSERVRQAALAELARCEAPKAIVLLVEAMERSDTVEGRLRAAQALAKKFKMDHQSLDPADLVQWRNFVETIKGSPAVAAAFESLSVPLTRHPEHLIPMPEEH